MMVTGLRRRWRRWRFGLSTLFGVKPQGYFIPYRYAAGDRRGQGYALAAARLAAAEAEFDTVLGWIDQRAAALSAFAGPPPRPRWTQDWFPRLDGAAAYAIIGQCRPRRIVEIGSGHSTRFMVQALADHQIDCAVTSIDPAPRADIARLPIAQCRTTIQEAERAPFAALGTGDVLFIDSSHILMPGSDVDLLFTAILPALPAGVLVHIHDIFLPDDYPPSWHWRGYNEQSAAALLLTHGGYQPLFASHYVATRMSARLDQTVVGRLPLPAGAFETSLWLRKG